MPASCSAVIAAAEELLDAHGFKDFGPNGLQVPGRDAVEHVVSGVSANRDLIERAVALDAGLVIVHHGILWDWDPRALDPMTAGRVRLLLEHGIGLAMFHICLDAHMGLGNNVMLARALGCEDIVPFGSWEGRTIGAAGRLGAEGVPLQEVLHRVATVTEREPFVWPHGPDRVRRLAVVTGSGAMEGAPYLRETAEAGIDLFLTGEPTEHTMAESRERGIHFVAAGHHATEKLGIQALGDHLAERFGVRHTFVDVPNPI